MQRYKLILAAMLAAAIMVPAGAAYGAGVDPNNEALAAGNEPAMKQDCMIMGDLHREQYFTLLAEKYTPEDVSKWKAAFQERKKLKMSMRDFYMQHREEFRKQREQKEQKGQDGNKRHHDHGKKPDGKNDAMSTLHRQFNEAIAGNNTAQIKSVMPQLLVEMETSNKNISKKLDELKTKMK